MLPKVPMAHVLDAISSHRTGRLSCVEAGELLGFSERHFRRLRDAFEERGEDGLIDRRRGRVSARAATRRRPHGWRKCKCASRTRLWTGWTALGKRVKTAHPTHSGANAEAGSPNGLLPPS